MVKQLHFKHKSGSHKPIPGLSHSDCSPKLRKVTKAEPGVGRPVQVLEAVPDHVVKVTLASEEYAGLAKAEEALPARVKEKIEDKRVEEWSTRVEANKSVRRALDFYESQGEIEVIGEFDKTDEEALKDGSLIVNLSEIAMADYLSRGIEIPEHLKGPSLPTDTVRVEPKAPKTEQTKK